MGRMWARDYVSAQLAVYEAHRRVSHRTYRLAVLATWPLPRSLSLSPPHHHHRRRRAPVAAGERRRAIREMPPLTGPKSGDALFGSVERVVSSRPSSPPVCFTGSQKPPLDLGPDLLRFARRTRSCSRSRTGPSSGSCSRIWRRSRRSTSSLIRCMCVWFSSSSVSNFLVPFRVGIETAIVLWE